MFLIFINISCNLSTKATEPPAAAGVAVGQSLALEPQNIPASHLRQQVLSCSKTSSTRASARGSLEPVITLFSFLIEWLQLIYPFFQPIHRALIILVKQEDTAFLFACR